jgi:hypothetical protein
MVLKAWIPAFAGMTPLLSFLTRSVIHVFKGMDTRIRGHDSSVVLPDQIGHPGLQP